MSFFRALDQWRTDHTDTRAMPGGPDRTVRCVKCGPLGLVKIISSSSAS